MTENTEDGVKPVAWMIPDWGVVYGPDGYRYLTSEQTKTNRADWEDGEYDKFQESMKGAVPLYAHPALQAPVVVSDDLRARIKKAIMLEVQLHDLAHEDEDGSVTVTNSQIDLLDVVCDKAADRVLAALSPTSKETK